jgi:hypothetical protein
VLQEHAKKFAHEVGIESFNASSGWLHCFKAQYGITLKMICDEEAAAPVDKANEW